MKRPRVGSLLLMGRFMRKLNVHDVLELAKYALLTGLITSD